MSPPAPGDIGVLQWGVRYVGVLGGAGCPWGGCLRFGGGSPENGQAGGGVSIEAVEDGGAQPPQEFVQVLAL